MIVCKIKTDTEFMHTSREVCNPKQAPSSENVSRMALDLFPSNDSTMKSYFQFKSYLF